MAKKKPATRTAKKVEKKASTERVSAEKFCAEWKKAADKGLTVEVLAKTLGMEKSAVTARKMNYQTKLGLKFPKLARVARTSSLDKAALQELLNG